MTVTAEMRSYPRVGVATNPRNPVVRELQEALNADGARPVLVVTRIFDAATEAALREFQGRHGLAVTGVCGPRDWGMIGSLRRSGLGPASPPVTTGTGPVDQAHRDAIEQILHPPVPPPVGGGPAPAHPPMTGSGVGGAFETDSFAALDAYLSAQAAAGAGGVRAAGLPAIAAAAQEETERYFAPHLVMASRTPGGSYHPGAYTPPLADSQTRAVDVSTAWGWALYFLRDPSYPTNAPLVNHQVHEDGVRPDAAEVNRIALAWVQSSAQRLRWITRTIRSWPAEAGSGTVFVNSRMPTGTPQLQAQWDLFTTLIHEFLHLVTHDNYNQAAQAVGGSAQQILIEGMTDHMRDQVWRGLLPGLAANNALRRRVEGLHYAAAPTPAAFVPHAFYTQMADAGAIVAQSGENNARAAYFMGRADLLGLGPATPSTTPLTNIAEWDPADAGRDGVYTVGAAAETVADVTTRTGASGPPATMAGAALADPTASLPAGTQVRVAGVRWHRAIAEDTRGQVAGQYGVPVTSLELANGWSAAGGRTAIAAGTLVLVPAR